MTQEYVIKLRDKYNKDLAELNRIITRAEGRANALERWLTKYRDQLKKENVYHKNERIINAINELLNETSTDI